jgi:hypothetical protein
MGWCWRGLREKAECDGAALSGQRGRVVTLDDAARADAEEGVIVLAAIRRREYRA